MGEILLVTRLLLGLVFIVSSITKLGDPAGFIRGVNRYTLIPRRLTGLAALLLIAVEAGIGVSLMSGGGAQIGILLATALLTLFTVVMTQNARRAQPLPCYCFGTDDSDVHPRRTLVRLSLFLVAALVTLTGVIAQSRSVTVRPTLGSLLLAISALIVGMWFLRIPDFLELHRTPMPDHIPPSRRISLRGASLRPLTIDHDGRTDV